MILVAACPGGNVSNFMTHLSKGNAALSVTLTAIATLLAIVMTPLNLRFWGSLYAPTAEILQAVAIDPLEMGSLVALLLGIPLLSGMLCNRFFPGLSKRLAPLFKIGSLLFFAVLVVLALGKNWSVFLDYIHFVLILVLMHNALAFGTGLHPGKTGRSQSAGKEDNYIRNRHSKFWIGTDVDLSFFRWFRQYGLDHRFLGNLAFD